MKKVINHLRLFKNSRESVNMLTGYLQTKIGKIPQVSTKLNYKDYLGAMKVRWSIGRDRYKVEPGVYAVGKPDESSDVFVTANYKLSFDHLRKNLDGLNAWILVLDTKGINVWCAAGKGTFGTKELVNRIKLTNLDQLISHRRLILPQLGAVGISAHQVKKETEAVSSSILQTATSIPSGSAFKKDGVKFKSNRGYTVVYGPVRASDIKPFIAGGHKTTREMRKVNFGLTDRAKLIPVDFVYRKYHLLVALALVFIVSGLSSNGVSFNRSLAYGWQAALNVFLAYTAGIVITPLFLSFIPGRPFALKGFLAGAAIFGVSLFFRKTGNNLVEIISWFLLMTAIASFVAMNFTGSSTYTSLSGVKKEMKIAIPLQIAFSAFGLVLFVVSKFLN
jgi:hypothetical protein